MRTRIGPALAGAGIVAALVLLPAAPAYAAPANIAISSPTQAKTYQSTSVAITGNANIAGGALETNYLSDLQVAVTFEGATGAGSCDASSCGANVGATADASTSFSYTPPALTKNGPYSATATVSAKECAVGGLLGCTPRPGSATTSFAVAVPPIAPRNVKAVVNSDGTVTVSWQANPEPDVIGYQVQRVAAGSSSATTVDGGTQGTSYTDKTTAAGGQFGYIVTAFRPGADGTGKTVLDTSSSAAQANVPVPVTTTTPVAGQDPAVGATTTTTVPAAVASGGANIAAFLTQAQAAGALPVVPKTIHATSSGKAVASSGSTGTFPSLSAPGPPNTYAPTLPYGASGPLATSTAGGSAARVPLAGSSSGNHDSLVYSLAAGLGLCALGVVLRIANKRTGVPALEPLGEEIAVAGAGGGVAGGGVARVGVSRPASAAAKAAARAAARTAWAESEGDLTGDPGPGAGPGPGPGVPEFAGGDGVASSTAPTGPVAVGAALGGATDGSRGGRKRRGESSSAVAPFDWSSDPGLRRVPPAAAGRVNGSRHGSVPPPAPGGGAPPRAPAPVVAPAPVAAAPAPAAPVASAPVASALVASPAPPPPAATRAPKAKRGKPDTTMATHPSVEEAVDYFRLIRSIQTPSADADKIEVTTPTG